VIAVTNEQADGSVWVLTGRTGHKTMSKIDVASGKVERIESVSGQATSIAQSSTGGLVLGTANGTSSAVVLYGGATGSFLGAVRMSAPIQNVAIASDGSVVYAVEAFRHHTTLQTFDISRKGFGFAMSSDAVGVIPIPGGSAVWVVRSNGSLYKFGFFPQRVENRIAASTPAARALSLSPNGFSLYVLVSESTGHQEVRTFTPRGESRTVITVPSGSVDIANSADGSTLLDAVTRGGSGYVDVIPLDH
jgi:hypothetical protein